MTWRYCKYMHSCIIVAYTCTSTDLVACKPPQLQWCILCHCEDFFICCTCLPARNVQQKYTRDVGWHKIITAAMNCGSLWAVKFSIMWNYTLSEALFINAAQFHWHKICCFQTGRSIRINIWSYHCCSLFIVWGGQHGKTMHRDGLVSSRIVTKMYQISDYHFLSQLQFSMSMQVKHSFTVIADYSWDTTISLPNICSVFCS